VRHYSELSALLDASVASWKARYCRFYRLADWIGGTAIQIPISSSLCQSGNSEWSLAPQIHGEVIYRETALAYAG